VWELDSNDQVRELPRDNERTSQNPLQAKFAEFPFLVVQERLAVDYR
jgi:hypothetical protein